MTRNYKVTLVLLLLADVYVGDCQRLRQNNNANTFRKKAVSRNVQALNYYWETESLGFLNYDATLGNPLRGIAGYPDGGHPSFWPENIPASLHHYKIGWDEVMIGDPDVVGEHMAFNWTVVDRTLNVAAQFRSHVILRFHAHYPGTGRLNVPQYLLQSPYNVVTLWYNEVVPWYGDPKLRRAMTQFIDHLGRRYDGDRRILAIQAGLIGFWGEWHTADCSYNWQPCDPDIAKQEVIQAYADHWHQTKIQFRYPKEQRAYKLGFGFHDDSFTYETVSGPPNGGAVHPHFFYDMSVVYNTSDAWKRGIIGGEVRPENSNCFTAWYPAGSQYHQDFQLCAEKTHATYADWSRGFYDNGVMFDELNKARYSHARLGYSFVIRKISAAPAYNWKVTLDVTLRQVGIAPFYYPLWLDVYCDSRQVAGVWVGADLSEKGSEAVVRVENIPGTADCLSNIEFKLGSTMIYQDRPIKWAQGIDGKIVLNIPLPPGYTSVRSAPKPDPVPSPLPFPPKSPDGAAVGGCYIVCATTFCPGGKRMGEDIRGLSDGDKWSVSTTGNSISVRCNINVWNANTVMFGWPGVNHKETSSPWAMSGNTDSTFFPVDYLMYTGHKTMSITPYNDYNWLGNRVIDFDILP